jgi:hypothetical protein
MPRNINTRYHSDTDPCRDVSPVHNAAEQPRPGLNEQYVHEYRSVSPVLVLKKKKSMQDLRANFANAQSSPGSWQNTLYKM